MPPRNKWSEEGGSVLFETLLGSIFFMLFLLFTIDLTQTAVILHKINYLTKKCAREASVSAGKRVEEIKKRSRRTLLIDLIKEQRAGRVGSMRVSLLDRRGNRLPDNATVESGTVLTLSTDAHLSMNFVPFRIIETLPFDRVQKKYLPDGNFGWKTEVAFIVE